MAKAKTAKKPTSVFDTIDELPAPGWRPVPKFAADERAGRLLALGYPRMFLTTGGDFSGTDAQLATIVSNTRIVPREALTRTYNLYAHSNAKTVKLATAVTQLLQVAGNHFAMYALEHLFGSAAVATALVDALEKYPTKAWTTKIESHGGVVIKGLGFVLWRVPVKTRDALRARLEKLYQTLIEADLAGWRPVKALDEILHGRAAAERARDGGGMIDLSSLLYVDDDPAWLTSQVTSVLSTLQSRDRQLFDIQHAVIGGPKLLAALRASTAKFKADQKKIIAAQLSLTA